MTSRTANLLLLLAGAFWGMAFVAQSTAMSNVGPMIFVGLRFVIAAILLAPLAVFEMRQATKKLPPIAYFHFISTGMILYLVLALQQVGLLTTTVTNSGVLTGLYVVITPIISLLLFGQRPHIIVWPCVMMTFGGIFLLSGGALTTLTQGDILTILCAIASAFQLIFVGRYASKYKRPMTFCFVQFSAIALVGTSIGLIFDPFSWDIIMPALPEILFTGIFASAVTFTIQAVAQRYTTAPQAAIFMSTEVLFAAFFAVIILGEHIAFIGYFGGLLIFIAMILTQTIPYMNINFMRKYSRS